jgi:hypothetical protein
MRIKYKRSPTQAPRVGDMIATLGVDQLGKVMVTLRNHRALTARMSLHPRQDIFAALVTVNTIAGATLQLVFRGRTRNAINAFNQNIFYHFHLYTFANEPAQVGEIDIRVFARTRGQAGSRPHRSIHRSVVNGREYNAPGP